MGRPPNYRAPSSTLPEFLHRACQEIEVEVVLEIHRGRVDVDFTQVGEELDGELSGLLVENSIGVPDASLAVLGDELLMNGRVHVGQELACQADRVRRVVDQVPQTLNQAGGHLLRQLRVLFDPCPVHPDVLLDEIGEVLTDRVEDVERVRIGGLETDDVGEVDDRCVDLIVGESFGSDLASRDDHLGHAELVLSVVVVGDGLGERGLAMDSHGQAGEVFDGLDLVPADQGPGRSLRGHDVDYGGTFVDCEEPDVDSDIGGYLTLALSDGLDRHRAILHVLLVDGDVLLGAHVPARVRDQRDEVGAAAMYRHQLDRLGGRAGCARGRSLGGAGVAA
jgi:hypothetical protein